MRRPRGPPVRVAPATPDGWQSIGLPADANSLRKPPNHSIHDSLGLAKPIHASQIKVPRVHDNNHEHVARDSPRHRKLQQQHVQNRDLHVADAFAANKSLRLARFETPNNTNCDSSRDTSHQNQQLRDREPKRHSGLIASPLTRAARLRECTSPAPVILHETIRGFDDAVDASPLAESNQVAITELFLRDWLDRFERERELYKSVVVHAEVAFRELHRMTARLALPNDVVTAFSCKIFDEMTEHFGPFSTIMRVLYSELKQAIYAPTELPYSSSALPYFAIVKNQKRILQSLRQELYVMSKWESRSLPTEDCNRQKRQERNDFLRYEINKVHATLLSFLDQCGLGLVRTIFREWYFVAVTSKRNSKKYVEYFSAWFGGSVKSLVPRVFLAWKHLSVERKVARMHEQLASDQEKLSTLQKRIDELTVQRNLAQLESLAIRNDRKHAEDTIQRLHRKIQSASSFLEVSQRREELVAQEGQLRVEAATFLPPLVLESLLRGFHNVGFLQPLHSEFALLQAKKMEPAGSRGRSVAARHKQPPDVEPSALQHCIAALQGMIVAHTPTLPSLEDAKTEEAHHTLQKNDLLVENRNSKHTQDSTATPTSEIPLHKCITLLHGMKSRVEDDRTAHLLFLSKADLTHSSATMSLQSHQGEITNEEDVRYASASIGESPHVLQELVELFEASLGGIRHQDEHYAKHAKLFSSRMLEQNEISVVPHTQMASSGSRPAINIPSSAGGEPTVLPSFQVGEVAVSRTIDRVLLSSIDSARFARAPFSTGNEDELNDGGVCMSLDQIPLLRARDFELSPQHTRAFIVFALGQLLAEYGSLLFSPADISAFVRNRMLQKVMLRGIAGGKHTFRKFYVPLPGDTDGEDGDGDNVSSDDEDTTDKTISGLSPNHGKSAKGGGILRKQTSQRQMQLAPRRKSSYRGLHAPIANDIDRGLSHLKTAYDVWNQLSLQLAQAEIVQARGFIASSDVLAVDERFSIETSALANLASIDLPADMAAAAMMLRPRLQLHIEPLPSGPLMNAAKDKDRGDAPTTPNGSHRRSMATVASSEWSYQTSKVRLLSLTDTQKLRGTVEALHGIVRGSTQSRAAEYASAKQTLRDVRCMQWHEACDLASHFTSSSLHTLSVATTIDPATEALAGLGLMEDDRRHVFECVGFDNDTIERLFSVEDHPQDELHRVQGLLERKKHILRHAFYCKHRPGITHATTLEDLWHVVKVLRLARDVRVLPTLRDEEVVGTYFNEQLFSPEDLAEVLLQLCNEQFLPHITPLSARVEFLLTHHLPLAMQNQSAIREIMHKTDVKKALSDHGQTLRTIFRRYCAKEKDILAAAAAKRRAAVVAANASVVGSAAASTAVIQSPLNVTTGSPPQAVGLVPPQGITRFMRLADWHAFIAEYKLLRARFTAEYATVVFCNVQEAESGLEDNLEMIYGEFTEAIVALSVCFFPDPFLRHATRVHQFIRRYLPVSPEEIRDHHG